MGRRRKVFESHYFTDFRREFGVWAGEQSLARPINVLVRRYFDPFSARCLADAVDAGNKMQITHEEVLELAQRNFRTYSALEDEVEDMGRCLICCAVEGQPHTYDCTDGGRWPELHIFTLKSIRGEARTEAARRRKVDKQYADRRLASTHIPGG